MPLLHAVADFVADLLLQLGAHELLLQNLQRPPQPFLNVHLLQSSLQLMRFGVGDGSGEICEFDRVFADAHRGVNGEGSDMVAEHGVQERDALEGVDNLVDQCLDDLVVLHAKGLLDQVHNVGDADLSPLEDGKSLVVILGLGIFAGLLEAGDNIPLVFAGLGLCGSGFALRCLER